ncbi:MAG: hypothetical protein K2P81_16040 [Bacteriovoracaceae bacterium]|nr:hypothetical protein [Bacteriovoracaceae bacterium]
MEKRTNNSEVKAFTFNALEGPSTEASKSLKNFEFKDLSDITSVSLKPTEKIIRAEREAESKTQFKMDSVVRDLRGLSTQEKDDLEKKITEQVERRLAQIREQAYREGIEKGRLEGVDAALKEAMQKHEQQIVTVEEMIMDLNRQCEERLESHRHDIYEMSKRLLKWLVFHEVKDDGYLPKLLEKLILEMNQRQNLVIRVNSEDFKLMPQILENLEKRLGALTNVRVEPDLNMVNRGIVLETENGLLDATPEAMFLTLDKLFETVVNHSG